MKTFRQYLRYCSRNLLWECGYILGFYLIGLLMMAVICLIFARADKSYGCIGSMLACSALFTMTSLRGHQNAITHYRLAIAMGGTRRGYLLCDTVLALCEGLVCAALALTICRLETRALAVLLPDWTNEFNIASYLRYWYLILFIVGMRLLHFGLTALINRFGMKAFFLVWVGIWIGGMLINSAINQYQAGWNSSAARLGWLLHTFSTAIGPVGWIIVGIAALLACAAAGIYALSRAEIRM